MKLTANGNLKISRNELIEACAKVSTDIANEAEDTMSGIAMILDYGMFTAKLVLKLFDSEEDKDEA